MDFRGDYFPEEHDERESKLYRAVKTFFEWCMYAISFFLYAAFLFMFIVNRDSKILDSNFFKESPKAENYSEKDLLLYNIYTTDTMNKDEKGELYIGTVQLYDIVYAKDIGLFEIGIKYNVNELTGRSKEDILKFELIGPDGEARGIEYKHFDTSPAGGRYGFIRICFSDVFIDMDSNDMYDDPSDGRPNTEHKQKTENTYVLNIYAPGDDEPTEKFTVYDNSVLFDKADYHVSNNFGFIFLCVAVTAAVIIFIILKLRKHINKKRVEGEEI